ncbi:DUF47 domain-containing protein [Exiguobacterium flavidum]|uniref:DUF47 domain-containing protein n=1 Tax=Exiguobacterium flavidum TaxID=2184695 RepID=UPI000DF81369|nr:DUF47 domain-containing protein [Exiguobacterium flavidum]
MFSKKQDPFAVRLSEIAAHLQTTSQFFVDFKINGIADVKEFAHKVKEYETAGDRMMHQLIIDLNNAFITPIDREDLLALANSLDDVLDGFEECSAIFEIYNIVQADDMMVKFVDEIHIAVNELALSMNLLVQRKLPAMREHVIKVKEQETICDDLRRKSIKALFATETDPIKIIQYKEIYESLESIADYCQDAANVIETIIMKNA